MATSKNANRTVVDFDLARPPGLRGRYFMTAAKAVDQIGVIAEETYGPDHQVNPAFSSD